MNIFHHMIFYKTSVYRLYQIASAKYRLNSAENTMFVVTVEA